MTKMYWVIFLKRPECRPMCVEQTHSAHILSHWLATKTVIFIFIWPARRWSKSSCHSHGCIRCVLTQGPWLGYVVSYQAAVAVSPSFIKCNVVRPCWSWSFPSLHPLHPNSRGQSLCDICLFLSALAECSTSANWTRAIYFSINLNHSSNAF